MTLLSGHIPIFSTMVSCCYYSFKLVEKDFNKTRKKRMTELKKKQEPTPRTFLSKDSVWMKYMNVDGDKANIADTMKLVSSYFILGRNIFICRELLSFKVGDSSYGKTFTNQMKHVQNEYCSDAEASVKVNNCFPCTETPVHKAYDKIHQACSSLSGGGGGRKGLLDGLLFLGRKYKLSYKGVNKECNEIINSITHQTK